MSVRTAVVTSPSWAAILARWISGLLAFAAVLSVIAVLVLRWLPPPATSFMLQRWVQSWNDSQPGFELRYRWVNWEEISPDVRLAVVAAEDQKFPRHRGFDLDSIREVLDEYRDGGRLRGASTISQQVAKNLFLWPGRSFLRKGFEVWFTLLIETLWPKRRILEVYLNIAEFGDGIYGVQAASLEYFGMSAAMLSAREAALLAAVLPNPRRLRADAPTTYVRERRNWILQQMRLLGGPAYLADL
jgi:monofunctional biosynthetic peptidoglycan transglycosylase